MQKTLVQRVKDSRTLSNDIGDIPDVVNPDRRERCRHDLKLFAETYFKEAVYLGWAEFHITALRYFTHVILHGGKHAFAKPRGSGKAQPLYSKVLTVNGFVNMGEIVVGQELASVDGVKNYVSGVFPQGYKEVYEVVFSDGRKTHCCGKHLWEVNHLNWRKTNVYSTDKLIERNQKNVHIPLFSGEYGNESQLPLDPWLLGMLIGDGSLNNVTPKITKHDTTVVDVIKSKLPDGVVLKQRNTKVDYSFVRDKRNNERSDMYNILKSLGLQGKTAYCKFIPEIYKNASRSERLQLLGGLIDSDGYASPRNSISFCSTSKRLAEDVMYLVRSLGGVTSVNERVTHYRYKGELLDGHTSYNVSVSIPDPENIPLYSHKKDRVHRRRWSKNLNIVSITKVGYEQCQCIKVTHKRQLYITDDFVVTHNTALARIAMTWAIVYGHWDYPVIVGATTTSAENILGAIKTSLSSPHCPLAEDFPEITYPLIELGGKAQATASQTSNGDRTRITWKASKIVLPTVDGSIASGTVVQAFGLTSGLRGAFHVLEDGRILRPTAVILDDPQTDDSAESDQQCATREKLINGAVLKMSAPDVKMGALMPCTIIRRGDMAHRLLDRKRNPSWRGTISKMLSSMPDDMDFWEVEYRAEYERGLLDDDDAGEIINMFYATNREQLEKGCVASWLDRIEGDDLTAIQTAMHVYLDDKESFFSEYQNEPIDINEDSGVRLSKDMLNTRCLKAYDLGVVPSWCNRIVAFCDIGTRSGLHYTVLGLGDHFQATVITRGHMTVEMERLSPEVGLVESLNNCIEAVTRQYPVDGTGETMTVEMMGIDVGYLPDICYRVIREHEKQAILRPTLGVAVKPSQSLYRTKDKRAVAGEGWIYAPVKNSTRPVRCIRFDANHWKTFTYNRCMATANAEGSVMFNGDVEQYDVYFNHLCAEYRIPVMHNNKAYDMWELTMGKPNHFYDTLVGCCMIGGYVGVGLRGKAESSHSTRNRKRKKFRTTKDA